VFTSSVEDERTDARTDGQPENIMPPPVSLACEGILYYGKQNRLLSI